MKAKDDPSWGKQFAGKKADAFSVVKDGSVLEMTQRLMPFPVQQSPSKAVTRCYEYNMYISVIRRIN